VDEDPAEVVGVLLDAVVESLDVLAVEEPKDTLSIVQSPCPE
jgi:hypothetical protein